MRDPNLSALLHALDQMAAAGPSTPTGEMAIGCEQAELRLAALRRRLGPTVEASPYLRFLGRAAAPVTASVTAASA